MINGQYCLILRKTESNSLGSPYERVGLCVLNTRHICVLSEQICTGGHKDYKDRMGRLDSWTSVKVEWC